MELQAQLKLCREQLEVLGYSRESSAEQRAFLLDMATQFQDLTQQALATQYSANDLLDRPELKIATLVRNRSESFARTFSHCAHTYEFDLGGVASETKVERPVARKVRREPNLSDLDDILEDLDEDVDAPEQGKILEWLKDLYQQLPWFRAWNLPGFDSLQLDEKTGCKVGGY